MTTLLLILPVVAAVALVYAATKALPKAGEPAEARGPGMREASAAVGRAAATFLGREYRVLGIFTIAVAVMLGLLNWGVENSGAWIIPSFAAGGLGSGRGRVVGV